MAGKSPDSVDIYVGSRVRLLRQKLGMSQEKLGDELGLTFQQVQKYEKGTNRISASRLQQIATIFKVSAASFFDGAPQSLGRVKKNDEEFSYSDIAKLLATADGMALAHAFRQIGDVKVRRSIVYLVENLADGTPPRRGRRIG